MEDAHKSNYHHCRCYGFHLFKFKYVFIFISNKKFQPNQVLMIVSPPHIARFFELLKLSFFLKKIMVL